MVATIAVTTKIRYPRDITIQGVYPADIREDVTTANLYGGVR